MGRPPERERNPHQHGWPGPLQGQHLDRTVLAHCKQEYVYINPTDSVVELRQGISDYIEFYNYERPHQSVGEILPARSYGLIA